jgi:hypothetical protein
VVHWLWGPWEGMLACPLPVTYDPNHLCHL